MQSADPLRRPGGRRGRVRDAVLLAAWQLVEDEEREGVSIAQVAERAGVHHASVYRRWTSVDAIVLDAAVARLLEESPVPDTGSLHGDLAAYAASAAADLDGPEGFTLLRALLIAAPTVDPGSQVVNAALQQRGDDIQIMLDRAVSRGEPRLSFTDVLDCILAPLYIRKLFGINEPDLPALLDRLVRTALDRSADS